jgi:hypothetical protein
VGCSSYLQLTQQRLVDVSSSSIGSRTSQTDAVSRSAVDVLLQLAEALKPLAEKEVQWVLQQGQQQSQQHQQQQNDQADMPKASQQQQAGTSEEGALQPQQQQQQQQQVQAQEVFSSWDWDYQLHCAQASVLQQLQDAALKQHMHLQFVLRGFSGLLQRLLGVQLLLRPAGQAETWSQHVRVVMLVKQQHQQQHHQHQQQECGIVMGGTAAAGGFTGGCSVEVLGTVYLDVGGGYGTRVLRYTRQEEAEDSTSNGSSSSSSSSDVHSAELPLVAAMPPLQWEQLSGNMQQQLLQQSSGAAAVAVGISGTRLTLQKHHGRQQQQQQRMLQESPSDYDDTSSSSSSSGALVLSVGQLWEFGHEMGHALHLVLSSRQADTVLDDINHHIFLQDFYRFTLAAAAELWFM